MSGKLNRNFYSRNAEVVARDLLGKILVHHTPRGLLKARIVETEAYIGSHDQASHASKGITPRTSTMFGPPGKAYVYLIYGMYDMFNVVTAREGDPQAVLIRAAEPLEGSKASLSGPGKLSKYFQITRQLNGCDLCGSILFFTDGPKPKKIKRSKRVGIDYAGIWKHKLLRFYDAESSFVSHPR